MWLKILADDGDSVLINWGNAGGGHPKSYRIGRATVEQNAKNIRRLLRELAKWGANPDKDPALLRRIMIGLANAGFYLRRALFRGVDQVSQGVSLEIQEWINDERAGGDCDLSITADPSIHIPWGLVCDIPLPIQNVADCSIESFKEFWGVKYSLAACVNGFPYSKAKLNRSFDHCRFISLVNDDVVTQIAKRLTAEQQAALQSLLARRLGICSSFDECLQRMQGAGIGDTVIHVLGHQHDGIIDLGGGHEISVSEFEFLIESIVAKSGGSSVSAGLVLISSCGGAYGDSDYSFVSAANDPGVCGLIATESAVPADFAATFAIRFLTELLIGKKSVGEAMRALRHDESMWPLSLLYGCYAQPEYRFTGQPVEMAAAPA